MKIMRWNKRVRLISLIGAAVCLCAWMVRAADTAYVNMETIFEGYYKTVRANAGFEQKKKDFEGRVDILRDELKSMVAETKKVDDEAANELLSNEAREEARNKLRLKVERLRAKEEEFNQFRRSGMADLNRGRLATEEELIKDISEFVRTYCKGKGFRLVYDINGRSLNRMPVVLVYPTDEEITPELLAEINKGHEEELKQATAEFEALRKALEAKVGKDGAKAEAAATEAAPAAEAKPAAEAAPAAEAKQK
jgi:Skp family chaperone for outer membrane proteins